MPIETDISIDYANRRITYVGGFTDDRPDAIYTLNELYSFLQDVFDEPDQMDDPIPMTAQTPTQYTLLYPWFMDNETPKALYGGSIQTSGWTKSGSAGVTALRYQDTPADPPTTGDVGVTVTGGTSTATGVVLAVDTARQIIWVRNTSAAQFQNNENVTGTGIDVQTMVEAGFQTGNNILSNLFSVGSLQSNTEIYVGQEPDQLGGTAYHDADADSKYERRVEKLDEWWDSDVDFTASPNLLGGAGHFDILVLTTEMGATIDGGRLAVFARQFSTIYSHFELVGGAQNLVVPFASTGSDLNAQDGPYQANFINNTGTIVVGDVLENDTGTSPVGRLRAVVTGGTNLDQASGTVEYYLIGENEPLATTDRTLKQFAAADNVAVRGGAVTFDISGAPSQVSNGPAQSQGVTITFGDAQRDVDQDTTDEEYACVIDCNNVALASVYKYIQFLTSRGNQDGSTADTQDTLLPSGNVVLDEAGEFYRAVGDVVFDYDGGTGTQPTEGDLVTNGTGSYGVVVSVTAGTTGVCVLTQVKGTFLDGDVVAQIDAAGGNSITVDEPVVGEAREIVDNTAAPFGTFAGGRWFVARGVVLDNVPAADANNWETVDLDGIRRAPPTQRTITFAGLVANDRAFLAEVNTAGGIDITKDQNGVGAAGASAGATSIPMDTTVALDVPTTGWVRVVDTSAAAVGTEYRFEYSSVVTTTITLRTGAGLSGTTTSAGTTTVLNDTGAFASFGTDGNVKIGHVIRKTVSGAWAVVVRKISDDAIETTPLSGAESWDTALAWEANTVVVALVDADTLYFPYIDDVASGGSIAKSIKYVADTDLVGRARFSSPAIGGTRILPFEQLGITLTDADLTITAIRTEDPIAA